MNNRGLQLLEDLKNVPNFDVTVLEQDLDSINHKWESSSEVHSQTYDVDSFFLQKHLYIKPVFSYKIILMKLMLIIFSYSNFVNS